MKDIERLIQQLSKVDPKVKIYDNFGHSHPLKSSKRNYFYFFAMAEFRPNSQIIGIFRKTEKFYDHFIQRHK